MPSSAGARGQAGEVLRAAELGVQRHVPARLAADRPGAARVGAPRGRRVVAALAVRQPDGVDGRQVEHVEAQLGELGQQLLDPGEAAPRAREELVPGAERRRARSRPRISRVSSETVCSERSPALAARPSSTVSDGDAEQRGALRRARSRDRSARPRPCARARAARRPRGRPTRRRRTASARARRRRTSRASDRGPRGSRRIGSLAPAALPGRPVAQRAAEHLVPVAHERRPHVDALADARA